MGVLDTGVCLPVRIEANPPFYRSNPPNVPIIVSISVNSTFTLHLLPFLFDHLCYEFFHCHKAVFVISPPPVCDRWEADFYIIQPVAPLLAVHPKFDIRRHRELREHAVAIYEVNTLFEVLKFFISQAISVVSVMAAASVNLC